MTRAAFVAVIAAAIAVGGYVVAQDIKKDAPARVRGQLPPNWSKLGLTDTQRQDVYKIQSQFDAQVEALQAQIKELRAKEKGELDKVLTADQKKRLREILDEKVPGAGGTTKPPDKN
jgi:hypothetical protein